VLEAPLRPIWRLLAPCYARPDYVPVGTRLGCHGFRRYIVRQGEMQLLHEYTSEESPRGGGGQRSVVSGHQRHHPTLQKLPAVGTDSCVGTFTYLEAHPPLGNYRRIDW
jgi:hypothetical protein